MPAIVCDKCGTDYAPMCKGFACGRVLADGYECMGMIREVA